MIVTGLISGRRRLESKDNAAVAAPATAIRIGIRTEDFMLREMRGYGSAKGTPRQGSLALDWSQYGDEAEITGRVHDLGGGRDV